MSSHIPGAYPAPFYDTVAPEVLKALPRSGTPIVIYCACPHAASDQVAGLLEKAGFTNVVVIKEGVLVWASRGYPMTFGNATRKAEPGGKQ
jgi:rhodanese-related sulfurtransferase